MLDINSHDLLSMFSGLESVRVVVAENRIHILPVASEFRAKKRLEALKATINAGEAVTVGSVASGVGILDMAAHAGFAESGLESKLAFANEIRDDCMEHMAARNPSFTKETITLTMPLQELMFDTWALSKLPNVSVLVGGIPCSGASVAGRAKRKLEHPEDHPEVGHLVVSYIAAVAKFAPAICVLENVPQYATSASMSILRSSLRDLGYEVHEVILDSAEWNMLEHRKRLAMVAVTKGIQFDVEDIQRPVPRVTSFGEIMEDVDPDHSTWGSIDYLWSKLERVPDSTEKYTCVGFRFETFIYKSPQASKSMIGRCADLPATRPHGAAVKRGGRQGVAASALCSLH
ncbi:DNA cytosine methyltransferase [Azonexus hydrophilus]|uniref:DNA cytosine methyltransferase n=1 Tax=Azonexus hydrophilus TaxID=418702 RepID=A0ABZ2XLD5_9RHOO